MSVEVLNTNVTFLYYTVLTSKGKKMFQQKIKLPPVRIELTTATMTRIKSCFIKSRNNPSPKGISGSSIHTCMGDWVEKASDFSDCCCEFNFYCRRLYFYWNFLWSSMSILYRSVRNARFVLKTKTSNGREDWKHSIVPFLEVFLLFYNLTLFRICWE